jgi:hypothetical protein
VSSRKESAPRQERFCLDPDRAETGSKDRSKKKTKEGEKLKRIFKSTSTLSNYRTRPIADTKNSNNES